METLGGVGELRLAYLRYFIGCNDFTFDGSKLSFTATEDDYTNGTYLPGDYRVGITGIVDESEPLISITASFIITLEDPCEPATSLVASTLTDQVYTLTDSNAAPYTIPAFTITPSFCTATCSAQTTVIDINGDDFSAVESFDAESLTFTFNYNGDAVNAALD